MENRITDKYHTEWLEETMKELKEHVKNMSHKDHVDFKKDLSRRMGLISEFYRKQEDGYNKYFDIVESLLNKHKSNLNEEDINKEIQQILICPDKKYNFINLFNYLEQAIEKGDKRVLNHYRYLFYSFIENRWGTEKAIKLAMGLEGIDEFYYGTEEFKKLINDLSCFAQGSDPILIVGETGTGKQLIARTIHMISNRRKEPFIEVNCAALPETLLESELFGVAKDYPGLQSPKGLQGKIKLADNGIMFLDELGKAARNIQSKILKVVDEKKFFSLGSETFENVDVHFIAAAQPEDLENNILPDLKYRFGFPDLIKLKSLNEKLTQFGKEVINIIFTRVLQRMGMDDERMKIDESCVGILTNYKYEGNYRELGNILRAAIRSAKMNQRDVVQVEDFQDILQSNESPPIREMGTSNILSLDSSSIKLKDIIDYADEVKKSIIKNKALEFFRENDDLKAAVIAEGMPVERYQNFWKSITKATGKSLRELKKMARDKSIA